MTDGMLSSVLAVGCAAAFGPTGSAAGAGACEQAKHLASDGMADDGYGYAVAIDGDVVAIGGPWNDTAGDNAGAVYVMRRAGDAWTEEDIVHAEDGPEGRQLGMAVAVSGDVLVAGAPFDDEVAENAGAAYVYRFDGNMWRQEAKLVAVDGEAMDQFGTAVAVEGTTLVVGSWLDDDQGLNSGALYPFTFNGSSWVAEDKLVASDGAAFWRLGHAVSMEGHVLVAGASSAAGNADATGAAYIYRRDDSAWIEEDKLFAADGEFGDLFGRAVSIAVDAIVVGASNVDDRGENAGAAYAYRWDGDAWAEDGKLIASDTTTDDAFGAFASTSGDLTIVGAIWDDDDGSASGSAYVFARRGGTWIEVEKITAFDGEAFDNFGRVALGANHAIVGAVGDDDNGDTAGAVYAIDLAACVCPADVDGNGAVDFDDLLRILDAWGNEGGPEDLDGSGVVDFQDIVLVLAAWGPCA